VPRLELVTTPTSSRASSRRAGRADVIGFAAETAADDTELLGRGRRKRERKGVDLLAVNRVDWDHGFEATDNRVLLLDAAGRS
jgi:phosphopantothenoylcysteine decarboxylase/phosphopantothenate--cysteine ligase